MRLDSADDSGKNLSRDVQVPPNDAAPATLTFSFALPVFHWAQVWIEGDAAPTANRAELGFWNTDVQNVVFVGGKDDFAAMPYAIAPGGNSNLSGIDTVFLVGGPTLGQPRGQIARRGFDLAKLAAGRGHFPGVAGLRAPGRNVGGGSHARCRCFHFASVGALA